MKTKDTNKKSQKKLLSECCKALIEIVEGDGGIFGTTTGAYICSKCSKFCVPYRN